MILQILISAFTTNSDVEFCEGNEIAPSRLANVAECLPNSAQRVPEPNPLPVISFQTRFSFGNHWVAGNPKHRVLPNISGKPEVSGTTRHFGYHRKRKTIPSSGALLWEPQKGPQGAKKVQNLPF